MNCPNFTDYIKKTVDCPGKDIVDNFEANTDYEYISTTFLNGYINYVKPIKAFMIRRYSYVNEESRALDEDLSWNDAIKNLNKELDKFHTDLSSCNLDDISILAESEKYYWWFYADRDCSDSCIMKINKYNVEDLNDLIEAFKEKCLWNGNNIIHEIPIDKMTGWITL